MSGSDGCPEGSVADPSNLWSAAAESSFSDLDTHSISCRTYRVSKIKMEK